MAAGVAGPPVAHVAPKQPKLLISPCEDEAPCALPRWCSLPDERFDAGIEVWRLSSKPASAAPEPMILGRRAWFQFGRRHSAGTSGRQPDIELHTRTASRKQALLLRNWHGQVFIMDMGSSHGTFLGRQRLEANSAKEWKPGVKVCFADRNTETFELLPRRLPLPALDSLDISESRPLGAAKAASAKFAGARQMMRAQLAQLGGNGLAKDSVCQSSGPPETQASSRPADIQPECPLCPLYPGEWQVPADGLSAIGWKPGLTPKAVHAMSLPEGTSRRTSADKDSVAAASLQQRPTLAVRIERKLRSQFGPDIGRNLHAWGPHYPCPDHETGWQVSLYTRMSARFDTARPAVVLTAAFVKSPPDSAVSLEWLTNIPDASRPSRRQKQQGGCRLFVRLTVAPPEVAEPATSGLWQLDLPLPADSESKALVPLPSSPKARLPSKFFVRICSSEALSHDGVPLGFEFGSSLRPVWLQGDSWSINKASTEHVMPQASRLVDLEPASASEARAASAGRGSVGGKSNSSHVSPDSAGILSSTSCASRASTLVASSSAEEDRAGRETRRCLRTAPQSEKGHASSEAQQEDVKRASTKRRQKRQMSNREFVINHCQRFFARRSGRRRTQQHSSDMDENCMSSEDGRPSQSKRSEEALMNLSAAQLLSHMKKGIRSRRLIAPDFKSGRLRTAYSQALEQLCHDGGSKKRCRHT